MKSQPRPSAAASVQPEAWSPVCTAKARPGLCIRVLTWAFAVFNSTRLLR
jgi:hypothetical protein